RHAQPHRGLDLAEIHSEPTVTDDGDGRPVWPVQPRGQRGRKPGSHRRDTVRDEIGSWLVGGPDLAEQDLVRSNVARDDAIAWQRRPDDFHDRVRGHTIGPRNECGPKATS